MKRNKFYIQHMLDAIIAIEEFIKDISKEKFIKSDMIHSAVIRKIEIIGEATKNLDDAFKSKYSFVPWKNIAGMRDKLIHGYFGVDLESVWEVTQKDLPLLKEQLGIILDDF